MPLLLLLLLFLTIRDASAASSSSSSDVLTRVAAELGIPSSLWDLATDPCRGRWKGVACCLPNSTSPCCASPMQQLYANQVPSIDPTCGDASDNASVAILILRSDVSNVVLNGSLTTLTPLCELASLVVLDLGLNSIRGRIPPCIGNLTSLQVLRLGDNLLNGTIPAEIGKLQQLQDVFLDVLQLEGSIPPELGNLANLQRLGLRNSNLQGEMPPELGKLGKLVEMQLQGNSLSGGIPASFTQLRNLKRLYLYGNSLTGRVNISGMSQLVLIDLRMNNFSGPLPQQELPQTADFSFNSFTGDLPDFSVVTQLLVAHNALSGPLSISQIPPALSLLDVSHNRLMGSLDVTGVTLQMNYAFNSFNNLPDFFNCPNTSACLRSTSSVRSKPAFFAVNCGGAFFQRNAGVRLNYDNDTATVGNLSTNSNASVGFFHVPGRSWALELSGAFAGTFASEKPISNLQGEDPSLYSSMRWSSSYMAYHGVGLKPGNYTVRLHFAELVFEKPGYRTFDVIIGGRMVKQGLDVVKEAGAPRSAYRLLWNTSVLENGLLSVELIFSGKDRYLPAGKFPLDNEGPMLCAISVVSEGFKGILTKKKLNVTVVVASIVPATLVLLLLAAAGYFWVGRKKKQEKKISDPPEVSHTSADGDMGISVTFTYQELYDATMEFSDLLGQGGFGAVYKGKLPNGTVIAVKQLTKHSKQLEEDFKKEIFLLSKLRHKNLLAVWGCALDSDHVPMLVTEFMPNGSLDRWLFKKREDKPDKPLLSWEQRRNIAIGVALALAYLHEESECRIIHLDVKPANILLDSDMNPRLADFGLARLYDEKQSHITATRLRGTAGYLAPEYAMHLQLSDKADVYSFGVVLLELLAGRRAIDLTASSEKVVLVDWAHREARLPSSLLDVIDKKLGDKLDEQQARDMVSIAIVCTQREAQLRPRMQMVWLMLCGKLPVPEYLAALEQATSDGAAAVASTWSNRFPLGFSDSATTSAAAYEHSEVVSASSLN